MKTGYDQFFKNARKAASGEPIQRKPATGMKLADFEKRLQQATQQPKPQRNIAEELRTRVKVQARKQKRKPFPVRLVLFSLMGLVVTGLGVWKAEEMEKLVHGIEISLLGSAHAQAPAAPAAAAQKSDSKTEAATVVPKKEYTQDEINHFSRLNERKRELDSREEELSRMEAELQTQREELDKKLGDLERTRRGIASVLEERVQADEKKVENLVQMYSNMKPQQAAKAFEEMDEDLAIEILGRMKKKNAAEILNLVKSEKVKVLSEKYAGYKRTTP